MQYVFNMHEDLAVLMRVLRFVEHRDAIPNEDVPIYLLTDYLHLLSYARILGHHHILDTYKPCRTHSLRLPCSHLRVM
jgi:hypothetical protein